MKIADVTRRCQFSSVFQGISSKFVFLLWAVFGGFILHFLLSSYLTVLLRPSYESPVDTAADLIERDIIPFFQPGTEIWISFFANSPDPNHQEISQRLVIAKDYNEYFDAMRKVITTGLYARIGTVPWCGVYDFYECTQQYNLWYRSSNPISMFNPYSVHLSNKKWPLKKVLWMNLHFKKMILWLFILEIWPQYSKVYSGKFHFFFFWLRQELKESQCVFVCPFGSSLSRALNLHHSGSGLS